MKLEHFAGSSRSKPWDSHCPSNNHHVFLTNYSTINNIQRETQDWDNLSSFQIYIIPLCLHTYQLTSMINKLSDAACQCDKLTHPKNPVTSMKPPKVYFSPIGIRVISIAICHIWTLNANVTDHSRLLNYTIVTKNCKLTSSGFSNYPRFIWLVLLKQIWDHLMTGLRHCISFQHCSLEQFLKIC